jgi:putative sigma-54 modulation protein
MTTTIQSVHFNADKKLVNFINEKVSKLSQVHEGIIDTDVILRLDKASDGSNKIAELKVKMRGVELFAKKQCASFEEALDAAIDAILSQVRKHKGKQVLAKS